MTTAEAILPDKRRVLVVDDHPIMRQGLAQILGLEPDFCLSGQAGSVSQALTVLREQHFDLAVVDVSLHGVSGIDLLKEIKRQWPTLPVLVFSMHDETLYAERALRAGARGYLMKQEAPEQIVAALRCILAGRIYVSPAVNTRILNRMTDGNRPAAGTDSSVIDALSNRELEVFRLIGQGRGTRDIAAEMRVSVKTVETYRAHIKEKLQLRSAPELMQHAFHWVSQQG